MTPNAKDLRGMRFGRLLAVEPTQFRKDKKVIWRCVCDCGKEHLAVSRSLIDGDTKSCGCLRKEVLQRGITRLENGISGFNQVFGNYIRGAKKRGLEFNISREDFYNLTQKECYYCGVLPKQEHHIKFGVGVFIYNGLDRLNPDVGYEISNLVPCCGKCNKAKSNKTEEGFLKMISDIYNYRVLKTFQVLEKVSDVKP